MPFLLLACWKQGSAFVSYHNITIYVLVQIWMVCMCIRDPVCFRVSGLAIAFVSLFFLLDDDECPREISQARRGDVDAFHS